MAAEQNDCTAHFPKFHFSNRNKKASYKLAFLLVSTEAEL